jgi:hypothetical protein
MNGHTRADVAQMMRRMENAVRNAEERRARVALETAAVASGLWRVRVRSEQGAEVRSLSVEAASPEQARLVALDHTQTGWRVIEVEAL